jgi:hypothetical protein
MFVYPIYNHNWRNIGNIYITRLTSKEIFSPSNKIHREIGGAKDLSVPIYRSGDKSLAPPGTQQDISTDDFDVQISYLQS